MYSVSRLDTTIPPSLTEVEPTFAGQPEILKSKNIFQKRPTQQKAVRTTTTPLSCLQISGSGKSYVTFTITRGRRHSLCLTGVFLLLYPSETGRQFVSSLETAYIVFFFGWIYRLMTSGVASLPPYLRPNDKNIILVLWQQKRFIALSRSTFLNIQFPRLECSALLPEMSITRTVILIY